MTRVAIRWIRSAAVVLSAAAVAPHGVGAQSIRVADSLLASGALTRAESLYYAAARARPHDPVARWALGRYLAARGAPRVAATLMEEALQFGGEPHVVGPDLAPVYERLDEYRELLALSGASLSSGERNRAVWLRDHPTRLIAPDTMLAVLYHPMTEPAGALGELPIRVDGHTLDAVVVPRAVGLVVSDTNAIVPRLKRFPSPEKAGVRAHAALAAAADSLGLGRLTLTNVPLTIAPLEGGRQALIGIDVFARLVPTFDPHIARVLLRPPGIIAAPTDSNIMYPTLLTRDDFKILQRGAWESAASARAAALLGAHRWTFDARRGAVVIEP